jgi:citrate lyase beta subunit
MTNVSFLPGEKSSSAHRANEHILAGLLWGMVVVVGILVAVVAHILADLDMVIEREVDCIVVGHIEVAQEVVDSRRIVVLEEPGHMQVQVARQSSVAVKDTKV